MLLDKFDYIATKEDLPKDPDAYLKIYEDPLEKIALQLNQSISTFTVAPTKTEKFLFSNAHIEK